MIGDFTLNNGRTLTINLQKIIQEYSKFTGCFISKNLVLHLIVYVTNKI
jgi:hypothetical protein